MKKKLVSCFFVITAVLFSCEKQGDNTASGDVVINELMPVNSTTVADQNGQYDDWMELYNKSFNSIDLSGYYLSDDKKKNMKWKFPEGVSIQGNGYLIIWADDDTTQSGLHANFKLSSAGEDAVLSRADGKIIDQVSFPAQTLELSYSRIPNGTGEFKWRIPTFNRNNDAR